MYYLLDTTITLFKRIKKGSRFWQSHNEHFYQIVLKQFQSHSKVCFIILIISIGLFIMALLTALYGNEMLFIFTAVVWCLSFIHYFSKSKSINKSK